MATVPQVYPLWLAEVRDQNVYAGRVVAWQVPKTAAATPVVAFTTPDGALLEAGPPHRPLVFLADTRAEAVAAAHPVAEAPPGDQPPAEEDEDDRRPPDPRARALTLRRLSTDEAAAQEAGAVTRQIHRHDR
jgi:hypothetical protein